MLLPLISGSAPSTAIGQAAATETGLGTCAVNMLALTRPLSPPSLSYKVSLKPRTPACASVNHFRQAVNHCNLRSLHYDPFFSMGRTQHHYSSFDPVTPASTEGCESLIARPAISSWIALRSVFNSSLPSLFGSMQEASHPMPPTAML